MYCVALYIGYRCMSCVVYWVYVYAFVVSHIVCRCMSCDVHCVRTCDVEHTLCRWCFVQVVLLHVVHSVLVYIWYCVCVSYLCCIHMIPCMCTV